MDSEVAELITNTQSITNLKEVDYEKRSIKEDIVAYNAEDQMVFKIIFNDIFDLVIDWSICTSSNSHDWILSRLHFTHVFIPSTLGFVVGACTWDNSLHFIFQNISEFFDFSNILSRTLRSTLAHDSDALFSSFGYAGPTPHFHIILLFLSSYCYYTCDNGGSKCFPTRTPIALVTILDNCFEGLWHLLKLKI